MSSQPTAPLQAAPSAPGRFATRLRAEVAAGHEGVAASSDLPARLAIVLDDALVSGELAEAAARMVAEQSKEDADAHADKNLGVQLHAMPPRPRPQ